LASGLFDLQDEGILVLVRRQRPIELRERETLRRTEHGNLDHLSVKAFVPFPKGPKVGGDHLFN
jgi:hypothetical protein